jgi:Tfp pilus assembly protein PilE
MPLVACSSCGHRISDLAPLCVKCGTPNRAYAGQAGGAPPRPSRGSSAFVKVLVVCGLLLGGVMVVGVFAAIAIPRFSSVSANARQAEAPPLLRQAAALQQSFHDQYGTYAGDTNQLSRVGWSDPDARYFLFNISQASDTGFCVDALPSAMGATSGVHAASIDETGRLYEQDGCPGSAASSAPVVPAAEAFSDDTSGGGYVGN